MGLFDKIKSNSKKGKNIFGAIDYGSQTESGGHDHRENKGDDRTPSQKRADEAKRKKD